MARATRLVHVEQSEAIDHRPSQRERLRLLEAVANPAAQNLSPTYCR
jgi:hypothetical protein